MQKKPVLPNASNGKYHREDAFNRAAALGGLPDRPVTRSVLGRAGLLRHPSLGRGAVPVAALIVGTYAVDERYVIVQAFPIGKSPVQLADVQLLDGDPGVTNDAVVWLVT